MAARSSSEHWGSVAKLLHWLVALFVIGMLVGGTNMVDLPLSAEKLKVYAIHKSLGITVLALMLIRLTWRAFDPRPADVPGLSPRLAFAAHAVHRLLYLALILMPISGWLYNSAANFPLQWFGLVNLPALVAPDPDIKQFARSAHGLLAYTIMVLVAVHAAAALKHHFIDRDATLRRMLWRRA